MRGLLKGMIGLGAVVFALWLLHLVLVIGEHADGAFGRVAARSCGACH